MKLQRKSVVRRLLKDVSGQTQVLWVLALLALIPAIGIVLELGNGYASTGQLQALANSVAIAGAENMPNTTTAKTIAGKVVTAAANNPDTRLSNIALSATNFKCLSSLTIPVGCAVSTGSTSGNYNAIQVKLTANVKSVIGGAFGMPSFATAATAIAVMNGGQNTPWNIAIIVDTTASMAPNDPGNLQCSGTKEACALQGVQELLKLMYPCASGSNCTAQSGNPSMVKNPVDAVSLFTFPAVTTATMSKDYDCSGSTNPTSFPYTFQNVKAGSQNLTLPSADTYQVIPFAGNYKLSDASTSLNANANIVTAVNGKSGCSGIAAIGGQGTYYAQVIYAAQAALKAQQTAYPGSQNAIILLGDGDADASALNANTSAGGSSTSDGTGLAVSSGGGMLNGTGTSSNNLSGYRSYTYPSALGQCGQAVEAANNAATNVSYNNSGSFTRVYTVGYGVTSGGCASDKTYSKTLTTGGASWAPGNSACQSIKAMASAPGYFYSDEKAGGTCPSPNQLNFTSLQQIFQAITQTLSGARLVPNSTT